MRNIAKLTAAVITTAVGITTMAPHIKNEETLRKAHDALKRISNGFERQMNPAKIGMPEREVHHSAHKSPTDPLSRSADKLHQHSGPIRHMVQDATHGIFKGILRGHMPKPNTNGRVKKTAQNTHKPKGSEV